MTTTSQIVCPHCRRTMPMDAVAPDGQCLKCALCGATVTLFQFETPSGITPQRGTAAAITLQLPGYSILRQIGQGGMGIVLEARQQSLDRRVAIKVLMPELARDSVFASRFDREAAALARLTHPNIVTIYERGRSGDYLFFIMEYVDGRDGEAPEDLRQFNRGMPPDSRTIRRVILEVAGALAFAHEQGIIHRDVKPSNILIDRHGRAKITDFGIAAVVNDPERLQLTGGNGPMGTPIYMAPEQRRNAAMVDARADIYSLGVVLYELLTGELPTGAYVPPSQAFSGREPAWDSLTERALQPNRELRFSCMREFIETIEGSSIRDSAAQAVVFPAGPPASPLSGQCGDCSAPINPINQTEEFCRSCGKPLWCSCPRCCSRHWNADRFCAECGTDVPKQLQLKKYTALAARHSAIAQADGKLATRIAESEQAGLAWAKALKLDPRNPGLRAGLQTTNELTSRLLIEDGDLACANKLYGHALERYEQAIELASCSPRVHDRKQKILNFRNSAIDNARQRIAEHKLDRAIKSLSDAQAQFPDDEELQA
jgi:serine/threonine protein kinase